MNPLRQPHSIAARLGYTGVLPFLFSAVNLHTGWPLFNGFALQIFVLYSAIILSFLGGIRWGLGILQQPLRTVSMLLAVLPSLIALACLLLSQPFWQIAALLLAFSLQGLLDWRYPPAGMPAWMAGLRLRLTGLVVLCHGIALLAVVQWT